VVYHKVTVFFACGKREFAKISHCERESRKRVARVRHATSAVGVVDVLYLSRVEAQHRAPSGAEVGSFRPDEFPCQAPGTGAFQQGRDDSVCCLQRLQDSYTTTLSFGAYLADRSQTLAASIAAQGACGASRVPPHNDTVGLLADAVDHVTGGLARMPRSHALLDAGAQTRGYRDVLLFLAERAIILLRKVARVQPS